jgi:hypothetical protein
MWRSTYRQRVSSLPGSNVSAQDMFDDYADWCEEHDKETVDAVRLLPQAQSPRRRCLSNFPRNPKPEYRRIIEH